LVCLQIVAKSITSEEFARELIAVLSVQYSIGTQQLLAAMKDRASVNEVAIQTLKIVYLIKSFKYLVAFHTPLIK